MHLTKFSAGLFKLSCNVLYFEYPGSRGVSVVGRESGAPGSNPITGTRRQVPKILEQDLKDKLLSDLRTELRSGVRGYINA